LWSDPDRLEIPARSRDEPRTQVIGRIGNHVWSAFTTRGRDRFRAKDVYSHLGAIDQSVELDGAAGCMMRPIAATSPDQREASLRSCRFPFDEIR
jgi:hypothetical protein